MHYMWCIICTLLECLSAQTSWSYFFRVYVTVEVYFSGETWVFSLGGAISVADGIVSEGDPRSEGGVGGVNVDEDIRKHSSAYVQGRRETDKPPVKESW